MNIFVLRHGEAGASSIPSRDLERPLTEAGKGEIEKIGESLFKNGVEFDRIATSPLARAKQTAEIVAKVYDEKLPKFEVWEELKPEGSKEELIHKLSKLRQDSDVMLVGHEPYLSTLIAEIIGGSGSSHIILKKGGVAKVQIASFVPKASGQLRWLLTPKQIKRMR